MDNREAWQNCVEQEQQAPGAPLEEYARCVAAPAFEFGGGRLSEISYAAPAISACLDRGEAIEPLSKHFQALDCSSSHFKKAARPAGGTTYRKRRSMGVDFRDSYSEGTVVLGKRTVKEGEACGIWGFNGEYRVVVGPRREWLFMSRVRFLDRHVADSHQYLVVCYRDGKKDHKRGPIAMFMDPVKHKSISVLNAVTVDAFEVIVVYSEDSQGSVKRSFIHGPTVFVPDTSQWLHVFRWHGSVGNDQYTKKPGALVFTKLRTIADQFYYNAEGVRTADDAALTIKVMVFFQLENLEAMLNSTHDPIGDFINGLLADLMNFGSRHTYEQFIQQVQQLSELSTYQTMVQRAEAVGYKIGKVVYRGYSASESLQSLCDKAIRTRTEMRLKQEESEQAQRLRDMELKGTTQRGTSERNEEMAKQGHKLKLEAASHTEALRRREEEHREKLRQDAEREQGVLATKEQQDSAQLAYLKGLRDIGVDLTQYMVACAEKSPDRVLKVAMAGPGGPNGPHIHTSL